jgi:hypothetical protein
MVAALKISVTGFGHITVVTDRIHARPLTKDTSGVSNPFSELCFRIEPPQSDGAELNNLCGWAENRGMLRHGSAFVGFEGAWISDAASQ